MGLRIAAPSRLRGMESLPSKYRQIARVRGRRQFMETISTIRFRRATMSGVVACGPGLCLREIIGFVTHFPCLGHAGVSILPAHHSWHVLATLSRRGQLRAHLPERRRARLRQVLHPRVAGYDSSTSRRKARSTRVYCASPARALYQAMQMVRSDRTVR